MNNVPVTNNNNSSNSNNDHTKPSSFKVWANWILWPLTILLLLFAVIGCLFNLYLVDHRGKSSWHLENHYVSLWPCLLLVFLTYQCLSLQTPPLIIVTPFKRETSLPFRSRWVNRLLILCLSSVLASMVLFLFSSSFMEGMVFIIGFYYLPVMFLLHMSHNKAFYRYQEAGRAYSKASVTFDVAYYILVGIMLIVFAVGYAAFGRPDAAGWAGVGVIVCIFNVCLVIHGLAETRLRRRESSGLYRSKEVYVPLEDDRFVEQSLIKKVPNWVKWAMWSNLGMKLYYFCIVGLLVNGSVQHGGGSKLFPPNAGKFLSVELTTAEANKGFRQSVYYECHGGSNASTLPTLIFESDGSHGLGDWAGIVNAVAGRHRVCVWDKPGLGWSEYMLSGQTGTGDYYDDLIYALITAEPDFPPPYIFVGWGGGGEPIYSYAKKHPEHVDSLVMLDAAPTGIEWRIPATYYKWGPDEYYYYVQNDLASRFQMLSLTNCFGVPWGIVKPFLGDSISNEFWSDEESREQQWYFSTEKTWVTQKWFLTEITGNDPNVYDQPISPQIPVHGILSRKSAEQVDRLICAPNSMTYSECDYQKYKAQAEYEEKFSVLRNDGKVIDCDEDDCSLGYLVFDNPGYTVENILNIYGFGKRNSDEKFSPSEDDKQNVENDSDSIQE